MKATGIVRRIDSLGRIVIPKEIRRIMGIKEEDALEIFTDKNAVILKKYRNTDIDYSSIKKAIKVLLPSCAFAIYDTDGDLVAETEKNFFPPCIDDCANAPIAQVKGIGAIVVDSSEGITEDKVNTIVEIVQTIADIMEVV